MKSRRNNLHRNLRKARGQVSRREKAAKNISDQKIAAQTKKNRAEIDSHNDLFILNYPTKTPVPSL